MEIPDLLHARFVESEEHHAMSVRAVCVCRLLRARTSPGSLNTKEKGFFGVSRRCTGGRGGLTLGLGINVFEKKNEKKNATCDLRELNR